MKTLLLIFSFFSFQTLAQNSPATIEKIEFQSNYRDDVILITFTDALQRIGQNKIPITVEPKIECHWSWIDNFNLACNLNDLSKYDEDEDSEIEEQSLTLATQYVFKVNDGLLDLQNRKVPEQSKEFNYKAPILNGVDIIHWNTPKIPMVAIMFNQEINRSSMDSKVFLTNDNQSILMQHATKEELQKFNPNNYNIDSNYIILKPAQELDLNTEYHVSIKAGIKSMYGLLESSPQTFKKSLLAIGAFEFLNYRCRENRSAKDYQGPCFSDDQVIIEFSSLLNADSIYKCQNIDTQRPLLQNSDNKSILTISTTGSDLSVFDGCFNELTDIFSRKLIPIQETNLPKTKGVRPNLVLNLPNYTLIPDSEAINLQVSSTNLDFYYVTYQQINNEVTNNTYKVDIENKNNNSSIVKPLILPISENQIQTLKGYVSILEPNKETPTNIPFHIQKSPFQVNIKQNLHSILLQVNNIHTSDAIANAEINLNYEGSKFTTTTDNTGIAEIQVNDLVEASDFELMINTDRHSITYPMVSGFSNHISKQDDDNEDYEFYENSFYLFGITDKPLYRAGETVNYKIYIRQKNDIHFIIPNSPLPDFKLALDSHHLYCYSFDECNSSYVLENPKIDKFGSITAQLKLPKSTINGEYKLNAFFKNEEIWGASDLHFQVSDFKNSEYKLNLSSTTEYVKGTQAFQVLATAEYYSGGKVIEEKGEIAGELQAKSITQVFPEYNSFQFSNDDWDDYESYFLKDLTFDSNGEIKTKYTPPENDIKFGTIKLNAGLKPKAGEWNYSSDLILPYRQQDYFLGLKFKSWQKNINKEITVETVLIDYKGKKQKTKSMEYFIQNIQDEKWTEFKAIECKNTSKLSCTFILQNNGSYKIKVVAKKKKKEIEQSVVFVVNDYSSPLTTKTIYPKIDIQADKQIYQIGDTAKINIYFPEQINQALITTERNQILDKWSLATSNGHLEIELPITDRHAPGFDVTVLTQQNNTINSIKDLNNIINNSLTLKVDLPIEDRLFEISTDKEIYRPKHNLQLNIKSHSPFKSEYSIAIIDQSIVDLIDSKLHYDLTETYYNKSKYYWDLYNNYQITPKDSTNFISVLKADSQYLDYKSIQDGYYGIDSEDKVELERVVLTGSRINREDLGAHANQVQGKPNQLTPIFSINSESATKPIEGLSINPEDLRSLFAESAFFKTDIQIEAGLDKIIDIPLPDNITQWRIIVLGTDTSGKLEINYLAIKASKNLELRSTLPIQLTQGDEFKAQYSVVNKTSRKVTIQAAAQVIQNDEILDSTKTEFSRVKKLESQTFSLPTTGENQGELELTAYVKTKNNADGLYQKIPVRDNSVELSISHYDQFDSEEKQIQFKKPLNSLNQNAHLSLNISNSLMPYLDPIYSYMEKYPHQCWEQQSAKAVITAIELASNPNLSELEVASKSQLINSILANSQDFQTSNGGMTFFGGNEDNINIFLSLHTLSSFEFLQTLGYEIPKQVRVKLKDFSNKVLLDLDLLSSDVERLKEEQLSDELTLMALHYADRESPNNSDADKIDDQFYNEELDTIYLKRQHLDTPSLTALLKHVDDETKQQQILKLLAGKFYSNNKKYFAKDSNFSPWYLMPSAAKDQCGLISQILKLEDQQINKEELLKHINGVLELRNQQGHFGNTLENSYCAKALFEFSKKYESNNQKLNYSAEINGELQHLDNGLLDKEIVMDKDISITIKNSANNQSYVVSQLKYHLPSNQIKEQNIGFNIQREYFIFNEGSWELAESYKIGDWVKTRITIHSPISRSFVAISDPVPGAWLSTDPELASNMPVGMRESLKHFDNSSFFYERQLNPATTRFYADYLPAGSHRISYLSQIRSEGNFLAMPAIVEEMYDDENRANTEEIKIKVSSD